MYLSTIITLFIVIAITGGTSQSQGVPLVAAKRIGSIYLAPVFLPSQQEYSSVDEVLKNNIDSESGHEIYPLHRVVLGYAPLSGNENILGYNPIPSNEESAHNRQRRSPKGGKGGGGGGGRGGGGGGSGSWSRSSSSASSGSWGGGHGGGKGGGGGKGYGK